MAPVTIAPATPQDLDDALGLFAGYQRFYTGEAREDEHNRAFLTRFVGGEDAGLLLLARDSETGEALGLANLYWTFTSTIAEEHVLMNDLFVAESARGRGVGRALIDASRQVAKERGSRDLSWQTMLDNRTAQRLYERTGAQRSALFEYELDAG